LKVGIKPERGKERDLGFGGQVAIVKVERTKEPLTGAQERVL